MKDNLAGNDNYAHFADFYQPFLIDGCSVRGNFIRLGGTIDTILSRHSYPDLVSKLLGEQMVLACMLSGNLLKAGGALTMQVRGNDGPVKFAVVDVNAEGDLRGYAELAEDASSKLSKFAKRKDPLKLTDFVGEKGYLAITSHAAKSNHQYQGIVALEGDSLSDALTAYFSQSEQYGVSIKVAVDQRAESGKHHWFASGMMVQHMPKEGGKKPTKKQLAEEEENWNRATILMGTVRDNELLDPELPAQTLLQRLFNEDGVWVYEPKQLQVGCRCNRDRVEEVLTTFPAEDLDDMQEDGVISVNCQFCNKTEVFREKDVARIKKKASQRSKK